MHDRTKISVMPASGTTYHKMNNVETDYIYKKDYGKLKNCIILAPDNHVYIRLIDEYLILMVIDDVSLHNIARNDIKTLIFNKLGIKVLEESLIP